MSDVLSLLKPSDYGFRGVDAAGAWSIAFPPSEALKCTALLSGICEIAFDDGSDPIRLEAGDLVLMTGRLGYRLQTSAHVEPFDGVAFFNAFPAGETALVNGGGDVSGVGGYFKFGSVYAGLLLEILPTIVHIHAGETDNALLEPIRRLMREHREPRPGGDLIGRHLAQALLIEALRLHIAAGTALNAGWLYALADPNMRAAMTAMHEDPARRWTLQDLAEIAGLSRTNFAARFKARLGETAMEYLTRWRMLLAADQLADGRTPIAVIAPAVGYESESAFGATFKRTLGRSPKNFAKLMRNPGGRI